MDQNFQTSFIPKKPIIEKRATSSRPAGMFTILPIFFLFAVLIVSGGLYFYKQNLVKSIDKMRSDLELSKNRFEQAKILQLQTLDKRLNASNEILSKHISISPIFKALQEITLKSVRYVKFDYVIDNLTSQIQVKITGQATSYRAVALQSDLMSEKGKHFIDPVFSNLVLDEKGNVGFELEFSVDPSFVNYKQNFILENDLSPGPANPQDVILN